MTATIALVCFSLCSWQLFSARPAQAQTTGAESIFEPLWASAEVASTSSLAWGDYDGDGDLDLATTNHSAKKQISQLEIYRNDRGELSATASWSAAPILTKTFYDVQWADVDGDGDLDLSAAVGDYRWLTTSTVEVYYNQAGSLATTPGWAATIVGHGLRIAWGDIDGDSDLDLAVGLRDGKAHLYYNAGTELALAPDTILTAPSFINTLLWSDLDLDSDLDLVMSGTGVTVYYNQHGLLSELNRQRYQAAGNTIALGDLDQDGYPDLALGTTCQVDMQGCRSLHIYPNHNGYFAQNPSWSEGEDQETTKLALGDYDRDGDLDLAASDKGEPSLTVYRNSGGALEAEPSWSAPLLESSTAVVWGDYDNDGDLDLTLGNMAGPLRIYRNNTGVLSQTIVWARTADAAETVHEQAWGDVDGDGDLDLALAAHPAMVYYNQDGQLAETPGWQSTMPTYDVAWGDVDNDGDLDLATIDTQISIFINEGLGVLGASAAQIITTNSVSGELVWGDIDNDDDLDLATSGYYGLHVYYNDAGRLETTPSFERLGNFNLSGMIDLESDGDLDLAAIRCVGELPCQMAIYLNEAGLLSNNAVEIAPGGIAASWGDYDDDGDLDLAIFADYLRLYKNNGGVFEATPAWSSLETNWVAELDWGDYDGDGDLDLAAAHGAAPAKIYRNDGGSLTRQAAWSAKSPFGPTGSISFIDYGNDNDLDLVTTGTAHEPGQHSVSIYSNMRHGPGVRDVTRMRVRQPGSTPPGEDHSLAWRWAGPEVYIDYLLSSRRGQPTGKLLAEYSLDGGGDWQTAVATGGTSTTSLATSQVSTNQLSFSSTSGSQDIPDFTIFTSTLSLTETGTLADLNVWLTLEHPQVAELSISLIAPNGQTSILLKQNGAMGANMSDTYFDDEGLFGISTGVAPFNNRYKPDERLSRLEEQPLAGTWTLMIVDQQPGNSGILQGWGINAALGETESWSSSSGGQLVDQGAFTSTITISDSASIADLNITLSLTHTRLSDLDIMLTSPSGEIAVVLDGFGLSGSELSGATFSDHTTASIHNSSPPYSGTFTGMFYTRLEGVALNGDWVLEIRDTAAGETGKLLSWNLEAIKAERLLREHSDELLVPAGGLATSTLEITRAAELIDLNLELSMIHPGGDWIELALTGPSGLEIRAQAQPDPSGVITVTGAIFTQDALANFSHKLLPGSWTLTIINHDENNAGKLLSWGLHFSTAEQKRAENSNPMAVPDCGELRSSLEVESDEQIGALGVLVDLEHPNTGQLELTLVAPGGQLLPLSTRRGDGANFSQTYFSDQGAIEISQGSAPFSAIYQPELPLEQFRGMSARGTWSLRIIDRETGQTGRLLGWQLTHQGQGGVEHTFGWDTFASGIMGQSDNVIFRLTSVPAIVTRPNSTAGPYLYGAHFSNTYPFRLRGTQVRVMQQGNPVAGARVYRLPAGQSLNGSLFGAREDVPFITDAEGYLQGSGQLDPGDRLLALAPAPGGVHEQYTIYYTNGTPTNAGVDAFVVGEPGIQTIEVSAEHPLLLFDLSVSLEWDAHDDELYLGQLEQQLRNASRHLYDFSNGQIALGEVTVYQNADEWAWSDVLVYANNRLRPFAAEGGIVITPTADLDSTLSITYETGQVHMGASWNRYGIPTRAIEDDWGLVLAHELGHYLLFQEDTYLGLMDGLITTTEECLGSAMGDVYDPRNSEFIFDQAYWEEHCDQTLAAQEFGRSEWQTLKQWYPQLVTPQALLEGPGLMPYNLTKVAIVDPLTPTTTLADPFFTLAYEHGESSSNESRAFLERGSETADPNDDFMIDLGSPQVGQTRVLARGAQPGDRLCVFDQLREQSGCARLNAAQRPLALRADASWRPLIQVTPVTTRSFELRVEGLPADVALSARLFPEFGPGLAPFSLTLDADQGVYTGTISIPPDDLVLAGYLQIWDDSIQPQREVVVSFSIGGNPGKLRGGGGKLRGGGGKLRGGGGKLRGGGGLIRSGHAPLVAPDGQMLVFLNDDYILPEGALYAVQGLGALPPLPPGKIAIGQGYRLVASPRAPELRASVSFQYLGNDVLVAGASENELFVHFWDGQQWQVLATHRDAQFNIAAAKAWGPGIYVLLAGYSQPSISAITPSSATNATSQTLTISGSGFLGPARLILSNQAISVELALEIISTLSVTATLPPGLAPGEYTLELINGDGQAANSPAPLAIFPASAGCFADAFESGNSQWTIEGSWGIVALPGGGHAMSDSPAGPYHSAPITRELRSLTSPPISLAGCPGALLRFEHDYVLAKLQSSQDVARVEVTQDGGASWITLAEYRGGRPLYQGDIRASEEWGDLDWKQASLRLPHGVETIQLRFVLDVDAYLADRGWLVDNLSIISATEFRVLLPMLRR